MIVWLCSFWFFEGRDGQRSALCYVLSSFSLLLSIFTFQSCFLSYRAGGGWRVLFNPTEEARAVCVKSMLRMSIRQKWLKRRVQSMLCLRCQLEINNNWAAVLNDRTTNYIASHLTRINFDDANSFFVRMKPSNFYRVSGDLIERYESSTWIWF